MNRLGGRCLLTSSFFFFFFFFFFFNQGTRKGAKSKGGEETAVFGKTPRMTGLVDKGGGPDGKAKTQGSVAVEKGPAIASGLVLATRTNPHRDQTHVHHQGLRPTEEEQTQSEPS
jgi:hypothetical protein